MKRASNLTKCQGLRVESSAGDSRFFFFLIPRVLIFVIIIILSIEQLCNDQIWLLDKRRISVLLYSCVNLVQALCTCTAKLESRYNLLFLFLCLLCFVSPRIIPSSSIFQLAPLFTPSSSTPFVHQIFLSCFDLKFLSSFFFLFFALILFFFLCPIRDL